MAVLYNSTSVLQAENELDLVSSYRRWQQNWNILPTVVETEKQRGQKKFKETSSRVQLQNQSCSPKKEKEKENPNPTRHRTGQVEIVTMVNSRAPL